MLARLYTCARVCQINVNTFSNFAALDLYLTIDDENQLLSNGSERSTMNRISLICSSVAMALMCALADNLTHAQSTTGGQSPNTQTTGESRVNITDTATVRRTPEYPALAKAARVSGRVDVEVVVDTTGIVKSAR